MIRESDPKVKQTMRENTTKSNARYSIEELAEALGISRDSVYKGIKNGDIPHLKVGRRLILPRTAINTWMQGATAAVGREC